VKVSLNWVKQYTDIDVPIEELVELAVARLGGVEGYTDLNEYYKDVVVAEVKSCEPHPNADKLSLCLVDDNDANDDVDRDGDGYIQVVCGAPNVAAGQLVAWIPPAATVPSTADDSEPFVLDSRELRGEISHGMIASPKELGLSDEHDGILVIDEVGAKPGQSFSDLYELDDVIIDIENKMFTHRPDGFGQLGVAREIAGIQHQEFSSPDWYKEDIDLPSGGESSVVKKLSATVEKPELCPRFTAVVIEGVDVQPSPPWLQSRLMRAGVTPRNNVVDITNYIMMLTAQPIHAFDFDKVSDDGDAKLIVRKPKEGETIKLINGGVVEPHDDATLICNENGPISIAGVMGGADSEISDNTTRIIIECANFNMYNIRRTSMIHGLFTDAVTRFSKGQSPRQLLAVLGQTVELMEELTGGSVVGRAIDVNHADGQTNPTVEVSADFVNKLLGTTMASDEMAQLLRNVEFEVKDSNGELQVTAPFWRTDIEIKEDIVEEIGRLHGFDQLPRSLPTRRANPASTSQLWQTRATLRQLLKETGANEFVTHSFVNGDLLEQAEQDSEQTFKIANALSRELQYYRLTPLPSLLKHVHPNIKAGFDEFTIFELAATHNRASHKDDDDGLPKELHFLDLVYASRQSREGAAFYQLRSTLDALANGAGLNFVYKQISKEIDYAATAPFDQSRSALIETTDGAFVGMIGELKQSVIDNFKLPDYCAAASVDVQSISEAIAAQDTNYQELSKYPSVTQDITLRSQEYSYQQLMDKLENAVEDELSTSQRAQFELLGVYQADGSDGKRMSWRVSVVDRDSTLEANQVNQLLDKAAATIESAERV